MPPPRRGCCNPLLWTLGFPLQLSRGTTSAVSPQLPALSSGQLPQLQRAPRWRARPPPQGAPERREEVAALKPGRPLRPEGSAPVSKSPVGPTEASFRPRPSFFPCPVSLPSPPHPPADLNAKAPHKLPACRCLSQNHLPEDAAWEHPRLFLILLFFTRPRRCRAGPQSALLGLDHLSALLGRQLRGGGGWAASCTAVSPTSGRGSGPAKADVREVLRRNSFCTGLGAEAGAGGPRRLLRRREPKTLVRNGWWKDGRYHGNERSLGVTRKVP